MKNNSITIRIKTVATFEIMHATFYNATKEEIRNFKNFYRRNPKYKILKSN